MLGSSLKLVFIFFVGFFLAYLYTSIPVCRYTVKIFNEIKVNKFLTMFLCISDNALSYTLVIYIQNSYFQFTISYFSIQDLI